MNRSNLTKSNFLVSIHHQENHSYQGTIQWLDTGKTLHFRSELELLHLIHEGAMAHETPVKLRSWQDIKQIQAL